MQIQKDWNVDESVTKHAISFIWKEEVGSKEWIQRNGEEYQLKVC